VSSATASSGRPWVHAGLSEPNASVQLDVHARRQRGSPAERNRLRGPQPQTHRNQVIILTEFRRFLRSSHRPYRPHLLWIVTCPAIAWVVSALDNCQDRPTQMDRRGTRHGVFDFVAAATDELLVVLTRTLHLSGL